MGLFDINVMLGPTPTDSEQSIRNADDLLRDMNRCGIEEALVYSSHARFDTFFLDTAGVAIPRGALARLVESAPVRQIPYGSDFPIMDFPYQLGRVLYADIPEETKHEILWENPRRLFAPAANAASK